MSGFYMQILFLDRPVDPIVWLVLYDTIALVWHSISPHPTPPPQKNKNMTTRNFDKFSQSKSKLDTVKIIVKR